MTHVTRDACDAQVPDLRHQTHATEKYLTSVCTTQMYLTSAIKLKRPPEYCVVFDSDPEVPLPPAPCLAHVCAHTGTRTLERRDAWQPGVLAPWSRPWARGEERTIGRRGED